MTREEYINARVNDFKPTLPEKENIQCFTCKHADRNPIVIKGKVYVSDRIDYGDCAVFDKKPKGVLFRNLDGEYSKCPKYESV